MRFSVAIPAYKANFLYEAIDSVLKQSYWDFELIVVDDCSPYDLQSIVASFSDKRVKYYRNNKNFGAINVVNNWNKCLSFCSGEYIICMGDDDRLLPNCLKDVNELINRYPQLNVYHLQTQIIDETGCAIKNLDYRPEYETATEMLYQRFLGRSQFIGDFCFYAKKLKEEGGFFFLPLAWTSDDITAYRAALPQGIANTQTVCFEYRENQYTISENSSNEMIKIRALEISEQWYEGHMDLSQDGDRLRDAMYNHYGLMYGKHIYNDLRISLFHIFYWLSKRRRYHVSLVLLCKIFLKSVSTRKND